MSKLFNPLAVFAFIAFIVLVYIRQNPTIIETHKGHGGRGHPHGRGRNGWWGNTQPTYLNHHKNRHNRHHQRGGWWFF